MPNRAIIDVYENKNMRTDHVSYSIEVCDDYGSTMLIFSEKSRILVDDIGLLKLVIAAKHDMDEHGTSSEVVEGILDYVEEKKMPMIIGGTRYEWEQIKEIFNYDIIEVYSCPKCGWESSSDSDFNIPCLRYGCDGYMSGIRKEWCEK